MKSQIWEKIVSEKKIAGLWHLMSGFRLFYLGALLSMALGALVRSLHSLLLRYVIDDVLTTEQLVEQLTLCGLGFVSIAALEGVLSFLRGTWSARTAEGVILRLRNYLFDHIQRLSFTYHDHAKTGELIQRTTSDVDALRRFYAEQAVGVGRIIALFVVNWIMLLSMNWRLGLVSVAVIPILVIVSWFFFSKVSKSYERFQEQDAILSTRLQENLSGVRVVKAFARQKYEREKFEEESWEKYQRGKHLLIMYSLYWPFSDVLCAAQLLVSMAVGAFMTMNGSISLGTYMAANGLVIWIVWPMRNLGRRIVQVSTGLVSYRRVAEIITQEREDTTTGAVQATGIQGDIVFENVGFAYQSAPAEENKKNGQEPVVSEPVQVLHDISFHCQPGQVIALLGSTGSGKTSIVNLLLRFYDYNRGRILLDGQELRGYAAGELRRQIGIVEQEPFLFSRTIGENIAYGAGREVTEQEIEEAAQAAAIHDIIVTFPKGYDTLVGEKGVTLSGGQRQRVAIARTLLKDPRLLILDDATSSVDTETEEQIRGALEGLMRNRTSFVIAHRIQSVMNADLILVLDKGRIIQQGTHQELIAQTGLYRQIYDIQAQIEQEVEKEVAYV